MKPGRISWATNDAWSTGNQSGEPSKYESSPAEYTEGLKTNSPVHIQTWNDWRWRCAEIVNRIASIRVSNLFGANVLGVGAVNDGAGNYAIENSIWGRACKDIRSTHYVVFSNRAVDRTSEIQFDSQHMWRSENTGGSGTPTLNYGAPGAGQVQWIPCTGDPSPASHPLGGANFASMYLTGFDAIESEDRVICYNTSGGIWYSSNFSHWTYWSVGTLTNAWGAVHTDRAGNWIFFNDSRDALYRATSLGGALSQVYAFAGLGVGTSALWHTHHAANDLFYGDAGNPYWLFIGGSLGAGEVVGSSDGTSWTRKTPTGETITPLCQDHLRYSKWEQRWCILNDSSSLEADVPTIIYSDDNGSSWTAVEDAFGLSAEGLDKNDCGACSITCDEYGHWLVNIQVDNGTDEQNRYYASSDNAMTWSPVFDNFSLTGEDSNDMGSTLWYGHGGFHGFQLGSIAGAAAATPRGVVGPRSEI